MCVAILRRLVSQFSASSSSSSSLPGTVVVPKRHRHGVILLLAAIAFAANASFCVLLPFYPQELAARHANKDANDAAGDQTSISHEVGIVFSACSLSYFLFALRSGSWIDAIGAKPILVWGTLALGAATLSLAALAFVVDYTLFVALSFVVAVFQGMTGAAGETACFALACREFPDNVGTVVGVLEQGVGIGIMLASPIGGLLYSVGGFTLPFLVLGTLLLVCAALAATSSFDYTVVRVGSRSPKEPVSTWNLLKNAQLSLCASCGVVTASLLGFLDTNLATFLTDAYSMTPGKIGVVFVLSRVFYAILAPLIGNMADRLGPRRIIGLGLALCWIGIFMMAMCRYLWAFIFAQVLMGLGIAMGWIPCFSDIMRTATGGQEDSESVVEWSGHVSGLLAAAFAFGEGIGSLAGGILADSFGFYGSAGIFGLLVFFHWTTYVVLAVCFHRRKFSVFSSLQNGSIRTV